MMCPQCGKQIPDISTSCVHCGALLGAGPSAPPPRDPANPGATALTLCAPRVSGLIARVQALLQAPAQEWPVIANEASTPRDIYLGYVAPLALIGVIARHSLITMRLRKNSGEGFQASIEGCSSTESRLVPA